MNQARLITGSFSQRGNNDIRFKCNKSWPFLLSSVTVLSEQMSRLKKTIPHSLGCLVPGITFLKLLPSVTGSRFARATAEQTQRPSWSRWKLSKVAWKDITWQSKSQLALLISVPYLSIYLVSLFPFNAAFSSGERRGLDNEKEK